MLGNANLRGCVCLREAQREQKRQKERARASGYHSGDEWAAACSEVSGGLGGEGLDADGVTVFAEDVSVQGVASLVVPLREQRATVLQDTDSLLAES